MTTVTVLASGVTLGVYVPALLVDRQLATLGVATDVAVLENLYTSAALDKLARMRRAFHESFATAQMAHRLPVDVSASLDEQRVDALLSGWQAQGRRHFVVWSGFWLPILDTYAQRVGHDALEVDLCRIDAVVSTSFRGGEHWRGRAREIWLWSWEQKDLIHGIGVTGAAPLPFTARRPRCVVHGGGWGIGTYQDVIPAFDRQRLSLDVVVQEPAEAARPSQRHRYFMVDPSWSPWQRSSRGRHEFPPLGRVADTPVFEQRDSHPPIHDLIARSSAIISKPGGGTLIDSLASATPLVLLEPYGPAEQRNADLWEHLGYGIPFARWRRQGFSLETLEQLHHNLRHGARRALDYPRAYARRLRSTQRPLTHTEPTP